jgi:DNA-directed RNA polymerase subunit N
MIIPVRCFTCNKMIAHHWEEYTHRVAAGGSPADVLDALGYRRYCCRRMFLTNVDLTQTIKGNSIVDDVRLSSQHNPVDSE